MTATALKRLALRAFDNAMPAIELEGHDRTAASKLVILAFVNRDLLWRSLPEHVNVIKCPYPQQ